MSAASSGRSVRTEDFIGPNRDKHRMIVNGVPEVHIGSKAEECITCQEAKRLASEPD